MKKRRFSMLFTRLVTKSPFFFYGFLLSGIALFLYLTITLKVETADGSVSLLYLIFVKAGRSI